MDEIVAHVRTLQIGDALSKTAAAEALADFADTVEDATLIPKAGGVPPLVHLLRVGSAEAKHAAAFTLGMLAYDNDDNRVLIAEAGGIPPLVELVRDGSADTKLSTAWALRSLASNNDANKALIVDAGAVPPLVELLCDGIADAKLNAASALGTLARNNDANAVAVAAALSLEALVELARLGRVTVTVAIDVDRHDSDSDSDSEGAAPLAAEFDLRTIVYSAGNPAKRKAALVVAALFKDCVPGEVPDDIKAAIGSYL